MSIPIKTKQNKSFKTIFLRNLIMYTLNLDDLIYKKLIIFVKILILIATFWKNSLVFYGLSMRLVFTIWSNFVNLFKKIVNISCYCFDWLKSSITFSTINYCYLNWINIYILCVRLLWVDIIYRLQWQLCYILKALVENASRCFSLRQN